MSENKAYKIIFGEQKTDEWLKLREGKITGSVAKKVKGTGSAYLYEMLAIMTTNRPNKEVHSEHIDRGNELEPEALAKYAEKKEVFVATVSFIENGRLGYSPDGIVLKKKESIKSVKKMVEVKCPDTPNHIRYILENKIPSEYLDQVVHGFAVVDDCDEIDFVSYDPKFILKPLHIITVKRQSLIVEISTAQIAYDRFLKKIDESYSKLIS